MTLEKPSLPVSERSLGAEVWCGHQPTPTAPMNITLTHLKTRIIKVSLFAALASVVIPVGLVPCSGFATNEAAHSGKLKTGTTIGGAIVGGIIGNQRGRGLEGAVLGGVLGSIAGQTAQDSVIRSGEQQDRQIEADRQRQATSGR